MVRPPKKCLRCGGPKESGTRLRYCSKCRSELPTHKVCSECHETKTANNFSLSARKDKALNSRCIVCQKASAKDSSLKRLYGIDGQEYAAIKEIQNGRCAICQRATGATKALSVDHDHAIEKTNGLRQSVRGLLCSKCNDLLGHVRDNTETLMRAVDYLNNPPAKRILGE